YNLISWNDSGGGYEYMCAINTTGTNPGPYTVTVTRGQDCSGGNTSTPGAHTGAYFLVQDSSGVNPGYPKPFEDTTCAVAFIAANAGKGQLPGNGLDIAGYSFSQGGLHYLLMRGLGTSFFYNFTSTNCPWPAPTNVSLGHFALMSPVTDLGAVGNMTYICTNWANCDSPGGTAQDGSEPLYVIATAGVLTNSAPVWLKGSVGSTSINLSSVTNQGLTASGTDSGYTYMNQRS